MIIKKKEKDNQMAGITQEKLNFISIVVPLEKKKK